MDAASRYNSYEEQERQSISKKGYMRQMAAAVLIVAGLVGIVTALVAMPARYPQTFLPF